MTEKLTVVTERVDDIPLLPAQLEHLEAFGGNTILVRAVPQPCPIAKQSRR